MSIQNWPGGVISDVPPTPSGPYENSTASGVWTIQQAADYVKQGNWPTAGNVDPSAFIENLFSTYLYTGNGSTQTITNGIDLAGEGGLVWIKARNQAYDHRLLDTIRGPRSFLVSNDTSAAALSTPQIFSSYNSDGFSLNDNFSTNNNNDIFASWTFRKQPKFFDVVTWSGTGTSGREIIHALTSVPGCVIVKSLTNPDKSWLVWHRGTTSGFYLSLNATSAQDNASMAFIFGNGTSYVAPTSASFTVGSVLNTSGENFVAYLFAHDAGGFGLTGTDNVISCGSYTGNGSTTGPVIDLGYEPQWLLTKRANDTSNWVLMDNMRGIATGGIDPTLFPNSSGAEDLTNNYISLLATGFQPTASSSAINASGSTYIYIAIRRGPMKVPTTGTSVFDVDAQTTTAPTTVTTNFPVDLALWRFNISTAADVSAWDRLRGGTQYLYTPSTNAEVTGNPSFSTYFDSNTAFRENFAGSGQPAIFWNFRRAPGFFDVVCYTGTGSATTVAHNLTVSPGIVIIKKRNAVMDWSGGYNMNSDGSSYARLTLNTNSSDAGYNDAIISAVSSTTFSVGTSTQVNASGDTYVAYLFATCPGVSKVGSYTGTGTTQVINCGFTAGSRFVLIKRTDDTGDWYVWDSARGIVAGDDPYLLLNSTAAEVTNTDYVDTASTGFELTSTAPAAINASGGTFIFLAIA